MREIQVLLHPKEVIGIEKIKYNKINIKWNCKQHRWLLCFAAFAQNDNITIPETSPSAEDIERAEQLKNEGKHQDLHFGK